MRASRDLLFIPREEVTNMDHDPVASIQTLPAIALRGLTVFPNVLIHFDVGRAASIKAMRPPWLPESRCSWWARRT